MAEAILQMDVRGPNGTETPIDAIVDTGFNDELTMSPSLIAGLGLSLDMSAEATLAGNVVVPTRYFRAALLWGGNWRPVSVLDMEGDPLLGMGLLWRNCLTIDAISGGRVCIDSIS